MRSTAATFLCAFLLSGCFASPSEPSQAAESPESTSSGLSKPGPAVEPAASRDEGAGKPDEDFVVELDLTVGKRREVDLGTLVMVRGGRVEGRVVDEKQRPDPTARVCMRVRGDWSSSYAVDCDEHGRFRFEHVRPNRYSISLSRYKGKVPPIFLHGPRLAERWLQEGDVDVGDEEIVVVKFDGRVGWVETNR